jgi:hypothetical protein
MNSSTRPDRPRASRSLQLGAALVLAGCTAPPPGHPYWPLAEGNVWAYAGHQNSPTTGPSPRSERFTVKTLTTEARSARAVVEAWALGWAGAQGGDDEVWIMTSAGLLPLDGPPDSERVGLELPLDLAAAAPWEHTVRWSVRGGHHREVARSEVVGRRRLEVLAGTFDTVVVRTELRIEDTREASTVETYVLLRDFACGVGMVKRVVQDGQGHGHALRLSEFHVDSSGRRGCDTGTIDRLPLYGEAAIAAAATRRCDVAALERLGAALGEFPRDPTRKSLPATLLAACADAMPPSIASYLRTGRDPLPYAKEPELEAWIDRACPGIDASLYTESGWGQTTDPAAVFELCGLGRLGVRRDELDGTSEPLTTLPWALRQRFVEQGTSPASALAIARALLARERRAHSWVPMDIALNSADDADDDDGVPIEVSETEIRFKDLRVPLSKGSSEWTTPYVLDSAALYDALWNVGYPPNTTLLIAADAAARNESIIGLAAMAERAGFTRRMLMVERDDGRVGAIDITHDFTALWR